MQPPSTRPAADPAARPTPRRPAARATDRGAPGPRHRLAASVIGAAALVLGSCAERAPAPPTAPALAAKAPAGAGDSRPFEVWLVDQSNSNGRTHGGTIHVWDGTDLMGEAANKARPTAVIDLGGATTDLCRGSTGAPPVRPHMLAFNSTHSRAVLSFVASGHVVFFDAAARTPVACFRTTPGAGGARQAHAAIPSGDDAYVVVANQNGKLLERIWTDYATDTYRHDPAATLDLATCTTPNGEPCESPALRPDNAPICPLIERTSRFTYVTLRGGGLFIANTRATPMQIVGEYDRATVHPNGCGGREVGGRMYITSGGGTANNLTEFDVYDFPLDGYAATNRPNHPAPVRVFSADGQPRRDAHGMASTQGGRYLWAFDRGANLAEVLEAATGRHVGTVDLRSALSTDPTPDLVEPAPSGNRMFVTLRGPNPLSGDHHVAMGSTPGLGILQVEEGGRRATMKAILRISNPDASGVERADPHGIKVRLR